MLAALPADTDPGVVRTMQDQLHQATVETQRSLRARFAQCVRERRLAAALTIGEQIREQLPGTVMAGDFERLRPHLMKRIAGTDPSTATTDPDEWP